MLRTAADRSRTLLVAVAALLLAAAGLIALAPSASAHARLVSVSPAAGSTVQAPPTQVVVTFDDKVDTQFATVRVADASGVNFSEGKAVVTGSVVTQKLQAGLPNGAYTVTFHVVSDDGHPVSQSTVFTIAAQRASGESTMTTLASSGTSTSVAGAVGTAGATTAAGTSSAASLFLWALVVVVLLIGGIGTALWMRSRRLPPEH